MIRGQLAHCRIERSPFRSSNDVWMIWWARRPPRFRVDLARAGNSSMAMSLLATHLKLNRDGETFFIGGKVPQLNKESLIAHRAKRIAAASALLSKVLPDRGNHCAQRIEKCAAVNTVIEINIRRISDPERDNQDEENVSQGSLRQCCRKQVPLRTSLCDEARR